MNFGQAIEVMKQGKRVARSGWNGKGMWLVLVNSRNYTVDAVRSGSHSVGACIGIKSADDVFEMGWRPTSRDMLAEDWEVVE